MIISVIVYLGLNKSDEINATLIGGVVGGLGAVLIAGTIFAVWILHRR